MSNFIVAIIVILSFSYTRCDAKYVWPQEWSQQSPYRTFFAKGVDLMDQYDNINDSLEANVKSEENAANFQHIESLLETDWGNDKLGIAMKEALLLLKSLQQVNEQNRCNLDAYNILRRNYNAANGLPQWGYEKIRAKRRINKIVGSYVERHAADCRPLYFDLYKEEVKNVDPSEKEFAETLAKNMANKFHGKEESELIFKDAQKLLDFAQEYSMTFNVIDPVYCLQEMRRLTKDDPDAKFLEPQPTNWANTQILEVDREKSQKLFDKYMYEPCRNYVLKLEKVFEPADYDTQFLKTPAKPDELDYYLNWAAFRLCDLIMLNQSSATYYMREYENRMAAQGLPF